MTVRSDTGRLYGLALGLISRASRSDASPTLIAGPPSPTIAGIRRFLDSVQSRGGSAYGYRTPAASISTAATASLTEANVQAVLASIWSKTGKTKRLVGVVGSTLKRRFTSFSQYMPTVGSNTVVRSYSHGGESRKLVASVDLFVGDFGTIELIPSVFVGVDGAGAGRDDEGLLLDPDYLEIRYKRLPRHMPLQDAGGGKRGIVDQIYGLVVTQPQAHGKFQPA